ncbi:hypothetical protein NPIL_450271 [Nephila pilipes]|uniref:Uncharacterized protein n=1 Tax=Nephila pilipes TaxID=299642 RepID=A0A8X6N2M0_NEPPI|nr:hypothetical protein NPIL_450271 [Nephila pilipes]
MKKDPFITVLFLQHPKKIAYEEELVHPLYQPFQTNTSPRHLILVGRAVMCYPPSLKDNTPRMVTHTLSINTKHKNTLTLSCVGISFSNISRRVDALAWMRGRIETKWSRRQDPKHKKLVIKISVWLFADVWGVLRKRTPDMSCFVEQNT